LSTTDGVPESLPDVGDVHVLDQLMASVRKDIRGLDAEVKEKEREWNLLIREKRKMEMCYTKLKSKTLGAAVEEKQAAKNQQLQLVSPQQQQSQPSSRIVATEVMIT
jgi:hypothetical protein